MKEARIQNCKFQISQAEYYSGLADVDEKGQASCTKDKNGNYLDDYGNIIDIDSIMFTEHTTLKEHLDYWKQELNRLTK
jgi:hypothetical protein